MDEYDSVHTKWWIEDLGMRSGNVARTIKRNSLQGETQGAEQRRYDWCGMLSDKNSTSILNKKALVN